MSRPYVWDARTKAYRVRDRYGNEVFRPTKLAAGMMATAARSGHSLGGPALSLAVRGHAARSPYLTPIRRQVYRFEIHPSARARLNQLRAKRAGGGS